MAKYINIGNTDFASVRKDEYVDKSQLIAYVNHVLGTQRKFLCVTRARRFGKSLAAKMLCAYYDHSCDSHSLFADLKIANDPTYKEHLNSYPVIYLDASIFTAELKSNSTRIVHEMNDVLSLAYIAARQYYQFIRELPTGKGFADIVLIPYRNVDKPAVVIELKYDHSALGAIRQIKEKRYLDTLSDYVGEVVLVGINYDKKTKKHECIIERLDGSIAKNDTQNDTQGSPNDTQADTQGKLKGKALDAWILAQIRKNPKVSTERLAQLSGRGIATIKRHTAAMPNIRFQGSGYSGEWIIIEQQINKYNKEK